MKQVKCFEYSKDWTSHDFYGKYHLHHMKNPQPVPGTQVMKEYEHNEKKAADVQRFEKQTEERLLKLSKRRELKNMSTKVSDETYI